jgi:pyridoxal phosphate enzyme (YggS family)
MPEQILSKVQRLRQRIIGACRRLNRNSDEIRLVAVTKTVDSLQIQEVIKAGIFEIGENRVQDAQLKFNALRPPQSVGGRPSKSCGWRTSPIRWHLIGHLQTNKAKEAVRIFDLIQSVDSFKLALEIDKHAAKVNKLQDILVQVNTSQEASKFGLKPDDTLEAIKQISQLKNVRIQGLMTIAPVVDKPEKARPFFRRLRELRDEINRLSSIVYRLSDLSMGMTDDFEIAIEEGATMLRIGRAIFAD